MSYNPYIQTAIIRKDDAILSYKVQTAKMSGGLPIGGGAGFYQKVIDTNNNDYRSVLNFDKPLLANTDYTLYFETSADINSAFATGGSSVSDDDVDLDLGDFKLSNVQIANPTQLRDDEAVDDQHFSLTFTTGGKNGAGSISLPAYTFYNKGTLDDSGKTIHGNKTETIKFTVDAVKPYIVSNGITVLDNNLADGEATRVKITFSEQVKGFEVGDITAAGGTVSGLYSMDNINWYAVYTATTDGTISIDTAAAGITDIAGNAGTATATSKTIIGTGTFDPAVDTKADEAATSLSDNRVSTITKLNGSAGFDTLSYDAEVTAANTFVPDTSYTVRVTSPDKSIGFSGNVIDTLSAVTTTIGVNTQVDIDGVAVYLGNKRPQYTTGTANPVDIISNFEGVIGSDYNDLLMGNLADAMLSGGAGDDMIYGGRGGNILIGGDGADTFVYGLIADSAMMKSKNPTMDMIVDFDVDEDVLDLTALNASVQKTTKSVAFSGSLQYYDKDSAVSSGYTMLTGATHDSTAVIDASSLVGTTIDTDITAIPAATTANALALIETSYTPLGTSSSATFRNDDGSATSTLGNFNYAKTINGGYNLPEVKEAGVLYVYSNGNDTILFGSSLNYQNSSSTTYSADGTKTLLTKTYTPDFGIILVGVDSTEAVSLCASTTAVLL